MTRKHPDTYALSQARSRAARAGWTPKGPIERRLPPIHVTVTPPPPSLFKTLCRWDHYAQRWMIVGSCYTPYRQKAFVSGVAPAQT